MIIRSDLKSNKRKYVKEKTETLQDLAPVTMKLAMNLAKMKGASSWLRFCQLLTSFFSAQGSFP